MSKCSQCAVKELIDSYGGLTEAKARSVKLRGKYNRSGLSNTDYGATSIREGCIASNER